MNLRAKVRRRIKGGAKEVTEPHPLIRTTKVWAILIRWIVCWNHIAQ